MNTLETTRSSIHSQPKKPSSGRRSSRDLALAERYRSRLKQDLTARAQACGPVYRLPPASLRPIGPRDVLDVVADRLLDVLAREAEQPRPFNESACRHERATLRLVRCDGDAPLR